MKMTIEGSTFPFEIDDTTSGGWFAPNLQLILKSELRMDYNDIDHDNKGAKTEKVWNERWLCKTLKWVAI